MRGYLLALSATALAGVALIHTLDRQLGGSAPVDSQPPAAAIELRPNSGEFRAGSARHWLADEPVVRRAVVRHQP